MRDTISRKAAVIQLSHNKIGDDDCDVIIQRDIETIKQLPPAEPQIIRCKDCKYWIPYDWMFSEVWQSKNIEDYPEDEIGCACGDMVMKANDFCSRAERRTE